MEALATALEATLPADSGKILAAQTSEICFDSNQDSYIDAGDNACDLSGFAANLAVQYAANPAVVNAADAVQNAVAVAVLAEDHENGVPYTTPDAPWAWQNLGGLSIYTPFHTDDWKRGFYTGSHLRIAQNGQWGSLLNSYWNAPPPQPGCTANCEPLPPIEIAPISAQASAGQDYIQLTWSLDQPVSGLAGYHVLRQISGTDFITLTTTIVNANQYIDTGNLTLGVTYCYQVKGVNAGSEVLAQSGVTCARFGELMLWVPHINALPGAVDVAVPINVAQAAGICMAALDVTISYNPAIAVANGQVSPTSFSAGYEYTANTAVPGQVHITAINNTCTPLYGPGTLFNVKFNILGASGQSSPVDFITGLSYTAIYDDNDLTNPVPLSLTGGSLTINAAYIPGDVNGDEAINAADALMALRIASGRITPTPRQLGACDVNGDGACTAADATLIRCRAAMGSWEGCGLGVVLNIHSKLEAVDMVGPELREANVQTTGGAKGEEDQEPVHIGLFTISSGQAITASLKIANGMEFAGGTFTIQYDPAQMEFDRASLAALTSGFGVDAKVLQPGLVRVAMARNTEIAANGVLLNLRFNVTGTASPVQIVDLSLNDEYGRDFATSALQKLIHIVSWHNMFLPVVTR